MNSTEARFKNVKKIGLQRGLIQDLYHKLLVISWSRFFVFYLVLFVFFNVIFALIYWLLPNAVLGANSSLLHAFAFSVQTFSTVGYGVFSPGSDLAHIIVIVESVLSVFVTAVLTGLIFAKFSRPSARIMFSKNLLINTFEGKKTLMIRMGNLRANQIAEAQVRMIALKSVRTKEGQTLRRQLDLKLVRESSLFFALTWSVMHIIDENSPLYNLTANDFAEQNLEIGVSVTGYDSTFSQTIHANHIYHPNDIVFDRYFSDVFALKDGRVESINYDKFHELA